MLPRHHEPIIAVATAPGRGAVGIVRLSGRGLASLTQALLGRPLRPREAHYLPFPDAQGQAIDRGLALFFPAPHSFTGEDVLELQGHGGPVVLQLLVARCLALAAEVQTETGLALLPHLRLAQPGEFSERAFLNGKLDLAQAEAIADLIDASTEAAARGASRSLSGEFSNQVQTLRQALVHLRMLTEATLDFPEEDIDFLQDSGAQQQLQALELSIQTLLSRARQGALLREGLRVVIAGQPNAGKSSLLNALAGAELAIVTPVPGTTRDRITQTIQIQGVPVHVVDTAGLRASTDVVEQIGVQRAWEEIAQADAVLFMRDLARVQDPSYLALDEDIAASLQQQLGPQVPVLELWNKVDAVDQPEQWLSRVTMPEVLQSRRCTRLSLSAKTGLGLDALRQQLLGLAGWQAVPEGLFLARERHVQALHAVAGHVLACQQMLEQGSVALDLLAEELRLAQNALNTITGEFGADDLLGVIFSQFCIGK